MWKGGSGSVIEDAFNPSPAPSAPYPSGGSATSRQHWTRVAALVVACGWIAGCGWMVRPFSPAIKAEAVEVSAAENANNNSPVGLDIVLIFDKKLLEKLAAVKANDWFRNRTQFELDAPDQMNVIDLEVVPGQSTTVALDSDLRLKSEGGLIFVDYPSPGDHRIRMDKLDSIRIKLLKESFQLEKS